MLDTYLTGEVTRLCSEEPVPVVRKTTEQHIPGGVANTAANLCALEAHVDFLGVVGRDRVGSVLRSALCRRRINDQWLVEDEVASILANDQYVMRFDEGGLHDSHLSPYTTASQQQVSAHLDELYTLCDVVVISDYGYGIVPKELIAQLCTLHAAPQKMILVDSNALQRFRRLLMTVITPNLQEARLLAQQIAEYHYTSEPEEHHGSKDQFVFQSNSLFAHRSWIFFFTLESQNYVCRWREPHISVLSKILPGRLLHGVLANLTKPCWPSPFDDQRSQAHETKLFGVLMQEYTMFSNAIEIEI